MNKKHITILIIISVFVLSGCNSGEISQKNNDLQIQKLEQQIVILNNKIDKINNKTKDSDLNKFSDTIDKLDSTVSYMTNKLNKIESKTKAIDIKMYKQSNNIASYYKELGNLLNNGYDIKVVENIPDFKLPSDIDKEQLGIKPYIESNVIPFGHYFQIKDMFFTLIFRGNMNFPINYDGEFSGILVAKKGDKDWKKFFEIENVITLSGEFKNNPIFFWNEKNKIFLTVVDANGAGSGEGVMKLISSEDFGQTWMIEKCYYNSFDTLCKGGTRQDLDGEECKKSEIIYNIYRNIFEISESKLEDASCKNINLKVKRSE